MIEDKIRSIINSLIKEIIEEEELEEASVTGDVDGYGSPFAFADDSDKSKKKKKRIATNSTGYKPVKN